LPLIADTGDSLLTKRSLQKISVGCKKKKRKKKEGKELSRKHKIYPITTRTILLHKGPDNFDSYVLERGEK